MSDVTGDANLEVNLEASNEYRDHSSDSTSEDELDSPLSQYTLLPSDPAEQEDSTETTRTRVRFALEKTI